MPRMGLPFGVERGNLEQRQGKLMTLLADWHKLCFVLSIGLLCGCGTMKRDLRLAFGPNCKTECEDKHPNDFWAYSRCADDCEPPE